MAYPASYRFSYLAQFGTFIGFIGAGIVIGAVASIIPLLGRIDMQSLGSLDEVMENLMVPENAGVVRMMQLISTFFLFFLPAFFYSLLCHRKPFLHLGLKNSVSAAQAGTIILLTMAILPLVGILGELPEILPFSEQTLEKFRIAEENYMKQVKVIGRMDGIGDLLISLFMMAILPAFFEETLFRGGLQNLFSRWWKTPILAIVVTSLIFSAVHFSYIGFIPRALLSFILGWVYYRTGNLWLSIIMHMTNNTFALVALYVYKQYFPEIDIMDAEPSFPWWMAIVSLVLMFLLLRLFERVSSHQVNMPGKEIPIPDDRNPFDQYRTAT